MTDRLLVFAPNWLGDAVMALPALAQVRASLPAATIDVAARPSVAPLFTLTPFVNHVVRLTRKGDSVSQLRDGRYEAALLLPNSFNVARMAWHAGIPERWGVRRDFRTLFLTRGITAPVRVHQADYYRYVVRELGLGTAGIASAATAGAASGAGASLVLSESQRAASADLLAREGWDGTAPLVALAPGAAFGGAKRWPASSFAGVIERLAVDGVRSVLVGTAADAPAAADVLSRVSAGARPLTLVGRTDLPALAGVLVRCGALVTNDSGAMHLAAALGVDVIAIFGPTNERETYPIGPGRHTLLTHRVWCRPCMLRECPLTQRCMTGISVDAVVGATKASLDAQASLGTKASLLATGPVL